MTNSRRVRNSVGAIVALVVSFCATSTQAQLLVQGYTPATAGMYDRFLNDPSFIGSGYNWSGVGRGIFLGPGNSVIQTGTWGTMISPSYFISANHFNPTSVGANNLRFHYTNDVNGGFEDRTYTTVGRIGNSDLWLGKLDTPVSNSVAKYPILSMPSVTSYASLPIYIFGLSAPNPGSDTTVRVGTNTIDVHNMLGTTSTPAVVNANVGGTVGFSYTFSYTTGAGGGEAMLQLGDSGAPNFYFVDGTMPAIIGLNWFALDNPDGSGSTAVPQYLVGLQAAMNEALSIVKNPALLGDYSLDGQLSAADLRSMVNALADLEHYKSLRGITQDYLLQIGDMNGDLAITNADLQPLIDLLGANGVGAGGVITVPEPATGILLALGGLAFVLRRARKTPLPPRERPGEGESLRLE